MEKQKIVQAGEIAKKAKIYAKNIIKKDMLLLEIANLIEDKIIELGGFPAFPVNLSINEIAAHYTPSYDDKNLAKGLLKVDLGVHIDGWIADTAFTLDLENSEENKKLIEASKKALEIVEKNISKEMHLSKIGKLVSETIKSLGFNPISNLSGHSLGEYDLHEGISIPNIDNGSNKKIGKGAFAIEPFATSGIGRVHDGKPSGIYILVSNKNIRSPLAREILNVIEDNFQTLPFASRWLIDEFGNKALLGLKQLEQNGNLHQFNQLIESSGAKVSQAENTFLIEEDKVIITTKD